MRVIINALTVLVGLIMGGCYLQMYRVAILNCEIHKAVMTNVCSLVINIPLESYCYFIPCKLRTISALNTYTLGGIYTLTRMKLQQRIYCSIAVNAKNVNLYFNYCRYKLFNFSHEKFNMLLRRTTVRVL